MIGKPRGPMKNVDNRTTGKNNNKNKKNKDYLRPKL